MEKFQISLEAARVNAKMTQDDAASRMHVTKRTIINWEKGTVIPSFASLQLISQTYGAPLDYIFLPDKSTLSEQ